jgi:hypothetical protein
MLRPQTFPGQANPQSLHQRRPKGRDCRINTLQVRPNPFRNTSSADTAIGEPVDTIPQTLNVDPETTNSSSITFLPKTFPNILPPHEDSAVLQNNDIVLPASGVSNLRRQDIFNFFAQYKGGCMVTIQNGEPFSAIDLWYKNSTEYGVRISARKVIVDALLITLDRSIAVGTSDIISDISSEDVFCFFQAGPDPGPTLKLVTKWTNSSYLPQITIPQGDIFIQTRMRGHLIAYVRAQGQVPKYWENKDLNIGNYRPSDGGYIAP